jgi:hypothetical protein
MTINSKLALLLALATLGIASPAFAKSPAAVEGNSAAQSRQIVHNADNPALTGGGSTAYNVNMSTDV